MEKQINEKIREIAQSVNETIPVAWDNLFINISLAFDGGEVYYFFNEEMDARKLQSAVGEKWFEKADIWPELNLMEVEMNFDSLIFQNAEECFIDPADQQWFEERGIKTKYQISYDTGDIEAVREVLHNIMAALGGRICSDTDDFEPSCTADTLDKLI